MFERSPSPENSRLTDDQLIDRELDKCEELGSTPDNATARVIASQIHGGQASELYAFTSTGIIRDGLFTELSAAFEEFKADEVQRRRIAFLSVYVAERSVTPEGRQAIEDWHKLWIDKSQDGFEPLCPCCHEDIYRPHRVGCPLGVDDEPMLTRVQELQEWHGTPWLHWANYLGFRNADELEGTAQTFRNHYYGFFPDIEAFKRNYEVDPRTLIEQQYLVVEGLHGGVYVYDR